MNAEDISEIRSIIEPLLIRRGIFDEIDDCVQSISIELFIDNSRSIDELLKEWLRDRRKEMGVLDRSVSFTGINDEGSTDDFVLNKEAITRFHNEEIYDDYERFKPSEELEEFIDVLQITKETRQWIIRVYRQNADLLKSMLKVKGSRASSMLTKNFTSRIQ